MKKYTLLWGLFALLFTACGDNDGDITPSNSERNWLVVEDSDNPLDHHRYLIYQETGIPIYYNDTIGSEARYSVVSGEYYTYYEVLQVFYTPGSQTPIASYVNVADTADVEPVLDFLEKEVLPDIPDGFYVPSILLVDTLNGPSGDTIAYKGFNTYVLGLVNRFADMDDEARKAYRGNFLATMVAGTLSSSESEWLEENFYALTYAVNPDNTSYLYSTGASTIGTYVYRAYSGTDVEAADQTLGGLGFLAPYRTPTSTLERMWEVPTKAQDVSHYCVAVFSYTEAEFEELHGEYPVVMEKFRTMRSKLEEYGFAFE